jgi:hypothetical protein
MICGYQISSGGWGRPMAFCAERKADNLPMCEAHFDDVMAEYGQVHMAPGNALGAPQWAMRLLWEGVNPAVPVEATAEELERYAPILTGGA